jgi:hypothetical protein
MGTYEHPVYMNEVEAEMLLGLLAADAATEDGRELHQDWDHIIEQLGRIVNG